MILTLIGIISREWYSANMRYFDSISEYLRLTEFNEIWTEDPVELKSGLKTCLVD